MKFLNLLRSFEFCFENLLESFWIFWSLSESLRIFQNLSESFRIFQNLSESFRIFQNNSIFFSISQILSKSFRIIPILQKWAKHIVLANRIGVKSMISLVLAAFTNMCHLGDSQRKTIGLNVFWCNLWIAKVQVCTRSTNSIYKKEALILIFNSEMKPGFFLLT